MYTWTEFVRNAIILHNFQKFTRATTANSLACSFCVKMTWCLLQRQVKQKFSQKYGHSKWDYRFPRDTTFHNFSQQFSQLHFYNFLWQKNGRKLKIVDLLQYLNNCTCFCCSILLLFCHFTWVRLVFISNFGRKLALRKWDIHLLINKSIFVRYFDKNVPVDNSFNKCFKVVHLHYVFAVAVNLASLFLRGKKRMNKIEKVS